MTRTFTGRHMAATMIGFFGIVIAVNFLMADYAVSTFSGTVVENSYVASQEFNGWLAKARAQKALGWTAKASVDGTRHVQIVARDAAGPLASAKVTALALHPLGREPDRALTFVNTGGGRFVSTTPLPAGRYLLQIGVRSGGHAARFDDQVPA